MKIFGGKIHMRSLEEECYTLREEVMNALAEHPVHPIRAFHPSQLPMHR